MQRRMDVQRGKLKVQALHSTAALARLANMTRQMLTRLLQVHHVQFVHLGRAVPVPMSQIEEKIPPLWENLYAVERARGGGEEVKGLCKKPARTRKLANGQ
jgi:hypothetical protein